MVVLPIQKLVLVPIWWRIDLYLGYTYAAKYVGEATAAQELPHGFLCIFRRGHMDPVRNLSQQSVGHSCYCSAHSGLRQRRLGRRMYFANYHWCRSEERRLLAAVVWINAPLRFGNSISSRKLSVIAKMPGRRSLKYLNSCSSLNVSKGWLRSLKMRFLFNLLFFRYHL